MRKLDLVKKRQEPSLKLEVDQTKQLEALQSVEKAVDKLYSLLNDKKDYDFERLAKQLVIIGDKLDLDKRFEALEIEVKALGDKYPKVLDINGLNELIRAVKDNKVEVVERQIDLTSLEKAISEVTKAVSDNSIKQKPEDFMPVRRVIKVGNRLVFDDQRTPSSSSGGGGGLGNLGASEVRYAAISFNASGDNTVVSAQSGHKIKLLSLSLVSGGTVNVTWKSGSTALSGAIPLIANSGYVLPASSVSAGDYLETATAEALILNLSANIQVSGHMTYYLESSS